MGATSTWLIRNTMAVDELKQEEGSERTSPEEQRGRDWQRKQRRSCQRLVENQGCVVPRSISRESGKCQRCQGRVRQRQQRDHWIWQHRGPWNPPSKYGGISQQMPLPPLPKRLPLLGMASTLPGEAPVLASAPMRMTLGKLVPFFELLFPYL